MLPPEININEKPDMSEYEMRKVLNLYSESELMRNVADYISDCLLSMGFSEDHLLTNIRIVVTGLACLVALYAVAVVPFPDDMFSLKCCVAIFFTLLFGLFLLETVVVKTTILIVKDKKGSRLFVDGSVSRLKSELVLGARQWSKSHYLSSYLGLYFDKNGFMVTDALFGELRKLLTDFDNGANDGKVRASVESPSPSQKMSPALTPSKKKK